jgi:hypothetical protein
MSLNDSEMEWQPLCELQKVYYKDFISIYDDADVFLFTSEDLKLLQDPRFILVFTRLIIPYHQSF